MGRPLTPETLVYGLVQASDPQLSPAGDAIVYTRTAVDGATKRPVGHLWRCDIDGGNARQLTRDGERNAGARWSPGTPEGGCGSQLAFISDRGTGSALLVLPLGAGGEAREVTRHRQAISNLTWSPDGTRIAYNTAFDPANPTEATPAAGSPPVRVIRRRDYKFDGRGFLGEVRQQLFMVEVASGERRQLTGESGDSLDHVAPEWSPDGRWLAVRRGVPGNLLRTQLALVAADSGATTLIGPSMGGQVCAWSPSGDRLAFTGSVEAGGQPDFYLYDLASGTIRRLTDDLAFLPSPPSAAGAPTPLVWLDDRDLLVHGVRAGGSGLYHVSSASGQTEPLVTWQALRGGLSVSADRRLAVQEHASLTATGELAIVDLATGDSRTITGFNEATFSEQPMARWEQFAVQRGAAAIDAWLFFPPDFDPSRIYPVVLDIHGGPHGYYGYRLNATQQCLATHGYLVVASNPRGSSSYGRAFAATVVEDNGGEDFRDLMAVLDAVLERPYADRERVGIWGYSYGGYMTAWTLGQPEGAHFKAAICGAPRFDNASAYGSCDAGPLLAGYQMGGAPWEQRARYTDRSPSTRAHTIRTPTLIVHGEADERCPLNQGEQFFNTLLEIGCEAEFVRYPNCSHGFVSSGPPEYRVDLLTRQLAWFGHYLR